MGVKFSVKCQHSEKRYNSMVISAYIQFLWPHQTHGTCAAGGKFPMLVHTQLSIYHTIRITYYIPLELPDWRSHNMCGNVRWETLRWNCFLAVLRVTKCDLWPGDMDIEKFSKLLKLQNPVLGILWEFRNYPLTYVFQPHETVCKEATLMAGGWLLDDMCLDTNDSRIGSPHNNCRLSNTK